MNVLFVSRKRCSDIGGLSRFFCELSSRFPNSSSCWSPRAPFSFFSIPFKSIDIIHLCDATMLPFGVFLRFLLRKPLTLTAHGLDFTFPQPLYQAMLRLALPFADALILDSHPALGLLSPFHYPLGKVHVIPPGVSLNHLQPPSFFSLPDHSQKIVLLTVGDLVLRKGHLWFIENVFWHLPKEFAYLIVGEGSERRHIEDVVFKLGLSGRVFLLGRVSHQELGFILGKADIYVCPNQHIKGNFEGFGIAAGEAAAMGLPVVASRADGIPEIIKDGKNGFLVEPKPEAFIEALLKLKDETLRKKLGKTAKIYTTKHYQWERTIKEYREIFEKVANG